ncbi:MAG: DUF695 domain-containing protein [Planctomycetota bacterium]|nr:DUF695 domain-containing protein [Planctomycetota bacterium]
MGNESHRNAEQTGWNVAQGRYEERPILARYRAFARDYPRAGYPERLNVFWRMSEPGDEGLGTPTELERLTTFEDRLTQAVEADRHTVFSVILTWNGRREFVLHTADVEGFLKRLGTMPHEEDNYPIEIQVESDPEWAYDRSVTPPAARGE